MKRRLKYPETRYAHPVELQYYAQGYSAEFIAHRLKFATSTVQKWLDGRAKIPWWTVELLRLKHWEHWQFKRHVCGIQETDRPRLFLAVSNPETALLVLMKSKELPVWPANLPAANDRKIPKFDPRYKYFSVKHSWRNKKDQNPTRR